MSTKDIIREGKKSFASELSASPTTISGAVYKQVRLPPINNGQAQQTISGAGTVDITFQITPRVMNLAKTKLFYQMQIDAQAAGQYTMVHNTSFGEIQYISLTPENGRTVAEVQYANNYLRMTSLMNTDREEFFDNGIDEGWYPGQVAPTAALNPTAAPAQYVAAGAAGGTAVAATVPNLEVQHLEMGAVAAVYPAANAYRNRKIPLSVFKGTLLALDKDIYFPCNMTLKVTFAVPKIGFSSTALNSPPTGALALTGNVKFQNINLLIQQETREDIIQQVKSFYSKPGVTIPIEWLKVQKYNQQGSQHNPQMNISSSDGKFIRRIISSPFASTETSNYGLDNSNICDVDGDAKTSGKVLSYRTQLDSNPIQNYDLSCVPTNLGGVNAVTFPSEDWEHNRKFLKNTAIFDMYGYYKSWFHIDDFLGVNDIKNIDGFTIGGLSTAEPKRYEVVAQICKDSGGANFLNLNWYMYAITGRDLVFNGSGVDIL